MYTFSNWTDDVAAMSERYQNALVTLLDESLVTPGIYDPLTDTYPDQTGTPDFWTGPARLIGFRWGVNRENSDYANSDNVTSVLVQFPKNTNFGTDEAPIYRIKRGIKLWVDECADNPSLETMQFSATGEMQGSNAGSRTVEFELDGDTVVNDD